MLVYIKYIYIYIYNNNNNNNNNNNESHIHDEVHFSLVFLPWQYIFYAAVSWWPIPLPFGLFTLP